MMVATDRLDRSPISRTKSVALQEINISDSLKLVPQDQAVEQLIDNANAVSYTHLTLPTTPYV